MFKAFRYLKTVPILEIVVPFDKTKHQSHSFEIFVLIVLNGHRNCQMGFEIFKSVTTSWVLQNIYYNLGAGIRVRAASLQKKLRGGATLSCNFMHFVDIHHLVIVNLLINNVFLSILLSKCILVLFIITLLSVGALHLRIEELEVNPWLLAVLDHHFELVGNR